MSSQVKARTGGHLVIECLEALGAKVVFGLPGIHALPMWEGLRSSRIRTLNFRTELNAGFAADGYARVSGRVAPLLLSTGPGALNALTALMEAASSHVPVVAVTSQIPSDVIGKHRGYLHELDDQLASFEPIVKWAARPMRAEQIPSAIANAFQQAEAPPSGPTYVEIPVDLLKNEVHVGLEVGTLDSGLIGHPLDQEIAEASRLLAASERPVIWAGGGVLRSAAWNELRKLAERLDAPVATTYMGKGAIPEEHPLSVGSAPDHRAFQELLEDADVVLCVGTELGGETTAQYGLRFRGRVIQIDMDAAKIGATYPALGLLGDARAILEDLIEGLSPSLERRKHTFVEWGEKPAGDQRDQTLAEWREKAVGAQRADAVRQRIARGLDAQGRELERGLLSAIRSALPRDAIHAWDMTILGYWAAAQFPALTPRSFLYALGSGTLGYAWPAALGAKAALPNTPALAVVGDGGFVYGIPELLTARQHRLDAKLLLIDDGGYGILREYQRESYGGTHGVDLLQPDFVELCTACGVPARLTNPARLAADLDWAMQADGPAALILRERLVAAKPTA